MTLAIATGTLQPTAPFDFAKTVDFLGGFGPLADEQLLRTRTLQRAVMRDGQPIVFRLGASGDVETPRLEYTLFAEAPIDAASERAVADRIAFFLSLHDDLRPFYALAQIDPVFVPVVEQLYGYHQVKFPTPFEAACWAILTQRNSMASARTLRRRLSERFGQSLDVDGSLHVALPEAETIAGADPNELQDMLPNLRRAEYLGAVARAFSGVDEGWLRAAPYDDVASWLGAIAGIGAWSTTFIMLRGLGRTDRFPAGETRIGAIVARRYNDGAELSQAQLERIAAQYGVWQGYWAHYLRVAG
jgi:DNA-3-methyladenine glycosylase II